LTYCWARSAKGADTCRSVNVRSGEPLGTAVWFNGATGSSQRPMEWRLATQKEIVAGELDQSHLLGGRSVFGWEPAPTDNAQEQRGEAPMKSGVGGTSR
jgi:hypothetical protein